MRKSLTKFIALFFISILFIYCVLYLGKKIHQRWIVYKTLHSGHWAQREREMEGAIVGRYKVIFFGNSLTEFYDLSYYYKNDSILNCGIAGDFSEGLVRRMAMIIRLKPKKLFIEIGINDMIEQIPLQTICNNYKVLIKTIRKECPATQIYIQSNLPVIINRPGMITTDIDVNNLVREQNRNLQELVGECKVTYIDLYTAFKRNGALNSLLIWDGIHLSPLGYGVWTGVCRPYVEN